MLNKFRRWLSDILRPKDVSEHLNVDSGTIERQEEQNGYDDPEYTMNLEKTLRVLETSLHNSDSAEEIAVQTMAAVCEFYDADFCGVLDVDLDVGVWTPEMWYDREYGPMHTTLFNEYEYSEHFYSWVQALRTGQPIIIPDVEEVKDLNPDEYRGYKRLEARSVMAIPFWKKPTGFLVVRNLNRYKDKSSLLQMLSFVCSQMWEDKKNQDSAALIVKPEEIKSEKDVILNAFGKLEIRTSRGTVDAKKGKIDVILVKDLSRLGRDYIVTGDYIEQIFNGYDTAEHNSGVMGFDVAVNNLINTFYSRDLSKKIKSGISSKWRRGVSTSSHAPYGYDKSKTEKGKYVVDPEAAKIVRLIFEKAADGLKTREIARILNEMGVLPPWEYLVKHNGWKPRKMITPESERLWDCTKVSAIIRKYDYTGAMVIGRRRPTSVGGKNMRVKPKSEWTIVEDVNEPIVSKELFEQANMSLRAPNVSDYTIRQKYPLKGKLRCGNCRHTLSRAISTYKEYFYCAHGTQIDDFSSCCTDQYPVEQMENIVWRSLKEHISTLQALGTAAEAETRQQFEVAEDIQKKLHHELEC